MRTENKIVHTVWIGDRLSLLEQLTIVLLQRYGHEVHLWSYQPLQNVPAGTVGRSAAEVLPRDSIFKFEGIPLEGIPNGGIGSLSHWSDQFQMKLLHQEGGIYSQLDVAVLQPLDFETPYVFAPFKKKRVGISPMVMKCPKGSTFTKTCYEVLSSEINPQTIRKLQWNCSMCRMLDVAKDCGVDREDYFLGRTCYWDLGRRTDGPFYDSSAPDPYIKFIHWSNATNCMFKDQPIPGSYYESLLKDVNLIPPAKESPLRTVARTD
jgi:hypothetical protein